MKRIVYTSKIWNDNLVINGNEITVTNVFGDTYHGYLDETGKVVTKSRLGLGYLTRVMLEYRREISSDN